VPIETLNFFFFTPKKHRDLIEKFTKWLLMYNFNFLFALIAVGWL